MPGARRTGSARARRGGSASDACERGAEDQLSDERTRATRSRISCDGWLDTCHAPEGAGFCEWLDTADAKVACGLALERPAGALDASGSRAAPRPPEVGAIGPSANRPAIRSPHAAQASPESRTARTACQSRSTTRAPQRGQKVVWPSGSCTLPV